MARRSLAQSAQGLSPRARTAFCAGLAGPARSRFSAATAASQCGGFPRLEFEPLEDRRLLSAPTLAGLQLVDPDLDNLRGQLIYLDIDGEAGLVYDGPVTVGPFDVPAFEATGELEGHEQLVVGQITRALNALFAATGVTFLLDRPQDRTDYSTIYIGGDDAAFSEHGSFFGLAEAIDVGNASLSDHALVFTDQITVLDGDLYVAQLVGLIAHEAAHLIGYEHVGELGDRDTLWSCAYPKDIHAWFIGQQAWYLYTDLFGVYQTTLELQNYFTSGSNWGSAGNGSWFNEGEYEEDIDDVYLQPRNHFCEGGDGSELYYGFDDGYYNSAYERANSVTFPTARNDYPSDKAAAYYWLGRTAHLLNDMCVPAHVHNDPHFVDDDEYEEHVADHLTKYIYNSDGYFDFDYDDDSGPDDGVGFYVDYATLLDRFNSNYKPNSLEWLFRQTTDYTDDYDSDDYDGDYHIPSQPNFSGSNIGRNAWHKPADVVDGSQWLDNLSSGEISILANDLVPWAIEQTAMLIRYFYHVEGKVAQTPYNLHATDASTSYIDLDWVGNGGQDGYVVFKKRTNQAQYAYYGKTGSSNIRVTGLDPGTEYSFRVFAYNGVAGTSYEGPEVTAETDPLLPEIDVKQGSTSIPDGGSFGFGTTMVGAPIEKTFTVYNTGNANLTVGSVSVPSGFLVTDQPNSQVTPGNSTTFEVKLSATSAGNYSGTLQFSNNDSNENPYNFTISGTVNPVQAPEIDVKQGSTSIPDGGSFGFGTTMVGAPIEKTFTVYNTGNANLTVGSVSVPSGFSVTDQPNSPVTPGNSTTFRVKLNAATEGYYSGTLQFSNNDSNENPYNFTISGSVGMVAPEIDVKQGSTSIPDGGSFGFGTTMVGAPIEKTFTVYNTGNANLTVGSVSVPSGFSVTDQPNSPVTPGNSTTFRVKLNAATEGYYSGTLQFSNNDSNENPYNFTISGSVGMVAPEIDVKQGSTSIPDGGSFGFGTTMVGAPIEKTFTIYNTGNANLTVGSVSVPSGFSVTDQPNSLVTPGNSTTFQVKLGATSAGDYTGMLQFGHNDSDESPYHFTISGTVRAEQPPEIGSLIVHSNPVQIGDVVTLEAFGVVDPDGGLVAQVAFYRDANGNGVLDSGDDAIGVDTTAWDGFRLAQEALAANGWSVGQHRVFAQAQDDEGDWGEAASADLAVTPRVLREYQEGSAIVVAYDTVGIGDVNPLSVKWNSRNAIWKKVVIQGHSNNYYRGIGIAIRGAEVCSLIDKGMTYGGDLAFIVAEDGIGNMRLRRGVDGADLNGVTLTDQHGNAFWSLPPDIDDDGSTDDTTALYLPGGVERVRVDGSISGDVVIGGEWTRRFVAKESLDRVDFHGPLLVSRFHVKGATVGSTLEVGRFGKLVLKDVQGVLGDVDSYTVIRCSDEPQKTALIWCHDGRHPIRPSDFFSSPALPAYVDIEKRN